MIMSIIHIAYITCLVTTDACHAYGVIVVYKIHHGASRISYFAEPAMQRMAGTVMGEVGARNIWRSWQYCGWLARLWARSGPLTFNEASKTVVG